MFNVCLLYYVFTLYLGNAKHRCITSSYFCGQYGSECFKVKDVIQSVCVKIGITFYLGHIFIIFITITNVDVEQLLPVVIVVGISVNIKGLKKSTNREGLIQILYPRPYSNSFQNATFGLFCKVDTANTLMLQYAFGV